MKKLLIVALCLGLAVSLLALSGCGKKETTIKTPEGEVKVEEEGGEVTFRTEEGETTYRTSEEAPSEEDLGAPIYPDAEYVTGSGGTVTGTSEGEEFTTSSGEFRTEDSFDEVLGWYKDELGQPMYESTSPREASWLLGEGEKEVITVSIAEEDGETVITIARLTGAGGL